jgi:hypothetical protein
MSIMVNVQPNSTTTVRFAQNSIEPPSLILFDGTATVVLSPASMPGGVMAAAVFARELAGAVAQWEEGCRHAATLAQSADPLRIGELIARLDNETG